MSMGGAWKESTSNDPRPPNRRTVAPPLVRDTIRADSLVLFVLNIEILLSDITKPEKSDILTLT